jgi:putative ABC transport system permease protein
VRGSTVSISLEHCHVVSDALSGMWDEVRFGWRAFVKRRGASVAIVLTLAIAFASSTLVYSTIDVVQHLIPASNRNRLVFVDAHDARRGRNRTGVSVPDLLDWTTRNATFDDLAAFGFGSMNLIGLEAPLRVSTVRTSGNFFSQWGITPAAGRLFVVADSQPGAERVVAVTDRFWRTQLGAQPNLVGRTFTLDGEPHVLVGILPPAMSSGMFWQEEVFVPLRLSATETLRDKRELFVTGRLKVGVNREQAAADLTRIARQLETEYPRTNTAIGATVRPLLELVGGNTPFAVFVLAVVVILLMVIACANIANVLLTQLVGRRHEFAVRRALGASRGQQVRQLLIESLVYSTLPLRILQKQQHNSCLFSKGCAPSNNIVGRRHSHGRILGYSTYQVGRTLR